MEKDEFWSGALGVGSPGMRGPYEAVVTSFGADGKHRFPYRSKEVYQDFDKAKAIAAKWLETHLQQIANEAKAFVSQKDQS